MDSPCNTRCVIGDCVKDASQPSGLFSRLVKKGKGDAGCVRYVPFFYFESESEAVSHLNERRASLVGPDL